MTNIQAFDHSCKIVYDFYMENGKLMRIRSWNYPTLKDISDEYRKTEYYIDIDNKKPITKEHFIKAVTAVCNDFEFNEFESFLKALNNDDEYLRLAREIMGKQLIRMTNQINNISKALFAKKTDNSIII